ncbi:HK97 family phage portal protein [Arthrobacter sp. UYNi723]
MAFVVSQGQLADLSRQNVDIRTSLAVTADYNAAYAKIWESHGSVQTVVNFLGRNIGSLGIHLYERVGDTDRQRITDHPLARMMSRPHPRVTRYSFFDTLVRDVAIFERYLAVKAKLADGTTRGLIRIPPTMFSPVGGDWMYPEAFEVKGTKGKKIIPAEDTFHVLGYSPDGNIGGVSPIESLRSVLAEEYEAARQRTQAFRNGARVNGYLERPKDAPAWSQPARDRFRAGWRSQYGGGGGTDAYGTPILEDGMKFVAATQTSRDLQYIESRKLTREEVASAYFIPPPMIGLLDHATFSNIKEQHKHLYQDTLGPWLQRIQQELMLQLFPDFEGTDRLYLEFNLEEKMRGSFEDQADQLQSATGGPYLTRNEARAILNRPSIEGGDDLIIPLNVSIGSTVDGEILEEGTPSGSGFTVEEIAVLVNAVSALIRSGFSPAAALQAVGLDPVEHLGLLPVTVQKPVEPENPDLEIEEALKALAAVRRRKASKSPTEYEIKAPTPEEIPEEHQKAMAALFAKFFARQRQVVLSAAGAKAAEWWDAGRWDRELAGDILAASLGVSKAAALSALDGMGVDPSEYSTERTKAFLKKVAQRIAGQVNAATESALESAMDDDDPDAMAHVFDIAEESRAEQSGMTAAATFVGFGLVEAARQTKPQARKRWQVNSGNPRSSHSAVNGEEVPIEDDFSNGMKWPGSFDGDVDEVANCQCSVVIIT